MPRDIPYTRTMPRILNQGAFRVRKSGSEEGSYFRLIYFVYHSTLGWRVIKKKKKKKKKTRLRLASDEMTVAQRGRFEDRTGVPRS
jgi:hypothetical protein